MFTRRFLKLLVVGLLSLGTILVAIAARNVSLDAEEANVTPSQRQALAAVRLATAKYHDVDKALADGYLATEHCIPGMGYHYVNPSLATDLELDALQPEILVYAPSGNGVRLVAVEYFVADVGQEHPRILDRPFDGPMPGHEEGMPVHYDLHVWIWYPNPDGIFTDFNPNVSC